MLAPKCLKCRHYYTTHNSATPRGCRAYRFTSADMPSLVVKRESGEHCQAFELKENFKTESKERQTDLNDPRLWGDD